MASTFLWRRFRTNELVCLDDHHICLYDWGVVPCDIQKLVTYAKYIRTYIATCIRSYIHTIDQENYNINKFRMGQCFTKLKCMDVFSSKALLYSYMLYFLLLQNQTFSYFFNNEALLIYSMCVLHIFTHKYVHTHGRSQKFIYFVTVIRNLLRTNPCYSNPRLRMRL